MRDLSLRNIECLGYDKIKGDKLYNEMKKRESVRKMKLARMEDEFEAKLLHIEKVLKTCRRLSDSIEGFVVGRV